MSNIGDSNPFNYNPYPKENINAAPREEQKEEPLEQPQASPTENDAKPLSSNKIEENLNVHAGIQHRPANQTPTYSKHLNVNPPTHSNPAAPPTATRRPRLLKINVANLSTRPDAHLPLEIPNLPPVQVALPLEPIANEIFFSTEDEEWARKILPFVNTDERNKIEGQGTSGAYWVHNESNERVAVFKARTSELGYGLKDGSCQRVGIGPGNGVVREAIGYCLGKNHIPLPKMAIISAQNEIGTLQEYIHSKTKFEDQLKNLSESQIIQLRKICLWDLMVYNSDRNIGNFLISANDEIIPIDQGCLLSINFQDAMGGLVNRAYTDENYAYRNLFMGALSEEEKSFVAEFKNKLPEYITTIQEKFPKINSEIIETLSNSMYLVEHCLEKNLTILDIAGFSCAKNKDSVMRSLFSFGQQPIREKRALLLTEIETVANQALTQGRQESI